MAMKSNESEAISKRKSAKIGVISEMKKKSVSSKKWRESENEREESEEENCLRIMKKKIRNAPSRP